jgi:peroxin-7
VYRVAWSPHVGHFLASACGDGTVRIWDTRQRLTTTMFRLPTEILTVDWNKYQPGILLTGGVDKELRVWDVRMPTKPQIILPGHQYAIRRAKWSPHSPTLCASASYDMTVRLWDTQSKAMPLRMMYEAHTEFVLGLDFSLFTPRLMVTSSWDESAHLWNIM